MKSRMDRYMDMKTVNHKTVSRQQKNKKLYDNIGNNTSYTNFTDVSNINAVSLDDAKRHYYSREGYHTIKEYGNLNKKESITKKQLDDFNYLYQDHENRIYDINSVIQQAKENRKEKDNLEEKRKLKNTNYNILANLNPKELERYHQEKQKRKKPDENELRGLIDTITSKTLLGEISKETGVDLLSDLMATNVNDKITPDDQIDLSKDIIDKESIKKIEEAKKETNINNTNDELKDLDKSFYTKSMDLSDKDFDFDGELEEKKMPVVLKILLILILIGIIVFAAYIIYKKI